VVLLIDRKGDGHWLVAESSWMGIDLTGLRALQSAKRLCGADFTRVVMLGRQQIHFSLEERAALPIAADLASSYAQKIEAEGFAEPLFKALGAEVVDSIDASNYEGATIIHDANLPLPEEHWGQYTFYCDCGSMEHVFSTPQVIANIQALLRVGGKLMIVTQCDGYPSHGFYQFSPEFFYSVFEAGNGFDRTSVFVVRPRDGRWFYVKNPASTGVRSSMGGIGSCYVVCLSQKTVSVERIAAQQSDYAAGAWRQDGYEIVRADPSRKLRFGPLGSLLRHPALRRLRLAYAALMRGAAARQRPHCGIHRHHRRRAIRQITAPRQSSARRSNLDP
jgi:hypothetical protein